MGSFSRAAANWESSGYGAMVSVPAAHPGLLAALCPEHEPGQLKELCMQLPNISCCVIFTRDSSSGRVEVDKEGRPVIKYWPCQQTIEHMLDVSVTGDVLCLCRLVRILMTRVLHLCLSVRTVAAVQTFDYSTATLDRVEVLVKLCLPSLVSLADLPTKWTAAI